LGEHKPHNVKHLPFGDRLHLAPEVCFGHPEDAALEDSDEEGVSRKT
jgi:hypothetical protein